MQMSKDPGREDSGRDWEHQPHGSWDDFQAARRRHLMRLAAQSDRFNRRGVSPPDEQPPGAHRRPVLRLASASASDPAPA